MATSSDQEGLNKARRAAALGNATRSTLQELGRRPQVVVKEQHKEEASERQNPTAEPVGSEEGQAMLEQQNLVIGLTSQTRPPQQVEKWKEAGTSSAASVCYS